MGAHQHVSHGEGLEIAGVGPLTSGSVRVRCDQRATQEERTGSLADQRSSVGREDQIWDGWGSRLTDRPPELHHAVEPGAER